MGVENRVKKRTIKKYINRHINPLIKNLPTTNSFGAEETVIVNGREIVTVYSTNHTIVNGVVKGEGFKSNCCQDILRNITLSAMIAKQIIDTHKHVYFRLFEIRGNQVRMRIITE